MDHCSHPCRDSIRIGVVRLTHWTVDPGSIFILGRTQTGKTTLAREIHAENNRLSIWLNEKGVNRVGNVRGKRVSSLRGLESGMASDTWKYNYLTADRESAIQTLRQWAWEKAEASNRNFRMQIVADEIHRLAPQTQERELAGRDAIRQIAKEGQKRNVKLVGITQDPVSMDKQTLRQRSYLALYGLSNEQKNYVGEYVGDIDRCLSQPEYAGVVYHADGSIVAEGVKAQARYA